MLHSITRLVMTVSLPLDPRDPLTRAPRPTHSPARLARLTHPCASPAVLLSGAEFERDEADLSTPGPPDCSSTSCAASSAAPSTPARTPCHARRMLVRRPSPGTTYPSATRLAVSRRRLPARAAQTPITSS